MALPEGCEVTAVHEEDGHLAAVTVERDTRPARALFICIGGEPRTTEEKVDDVAALNALTGANRTISLHVPWDDPADPDELRRYALERGVGFDAMNSNTFQDQPDQRHSYKFGSLTHPDRAVRRQAVEHNIECIEIGKVRIWPVAYMPQHNRELCLNLATNRRPIFEREH